jgi:hypothetical protein
MQGILNLNMTALFPLLRLELGLHNNAEISPEVGTSIFFNVRNRNTAFEGSTFSTADPQLFKKCSSATAYPRDHNVSEASTFKFATVERNAALLLHIRMSAITFFSSLRNFLNKYFSATAYPHFRN